MYLSYGFPNSSFNMKSSFNGNIAANSKCLVCSDLSVDSSAFLGAFVKKLDVREEGQEKLLVTSGIHISNVTLNFGSRLRGNWTS